MTLLVIFFLVSIIVSFLCSIMEAVLLSITPAYVGIQEQKASRIAKYLSLYKSDIDKPLSAILTLNTIAHTVGAIGVGSQAAIIFGDDELRIMGVSFLSLEALIAGGMTLAILIFSEVIPKTLGANNWEALTPFTVGALRVMLTILSPLVWLSQLITSNFKKDKDKPVLSRSDFAVMAQLGKDSGVLEEKEKVIIYNLLRFRKIYTKHIMTPRTVLVAADEEDTISNFHAEHKDLPFSRIPIFHGRNDNITGYVLKEDLLLMLIDGKGDASLKELRRPLITVPLTLAIPDLLDKFIQKKEHLSLVVDEYGGIEGVVSMEDIIETLLGLEILDETDSIEDMQILARKNWEKRARRIGIISTESEDNN